MVKCIRTHFGYRFIMEKIDLVVVGAEGVVESGGIINKVSVPIYIHIRIYLQSYRYNHILYILGVKQYINILIYCNIYYCNTIQYGQ